MDFVYHEELVKSCGLGAGVVQEFEIDGPNGERIVKVEVHTDPPVPMANPAAQGGYFVRVCTIQLITTSFCAMRRRLIGGLETELTILRELQIFTNFSNTYDFGDRDENRARRKPLPQPTPEQAEVHARLDREEAQVEKILNRLERRIAKPEKMVDELVCKEDEIIIGLIATEGVSCFLFLSSFL